jgi:hypothetical protein
VAAQFYAARQSTTATYSLCYYEPRMDGQAPCTIDLDAIQSRFEALRARLYAAKIAYLNGTPLDDQEVTYEVLRRIAQEVIQANYEFQKAKYGTVRVKLSVAKLLRRSW